MYETVFLGGTFDRIHKGHEAVLTRAFGEGQHVTIGLTSDEFVASYKDDQPQPYVARKANLTKWLNNSGYAGRFDIVPIDDPFEPAASGQYQALIVTNQNRVRGEEINAKRTDRSLTPLALIEVPIIAADDGLPISSARVRRGEIDTYGHLYMPEILRVTLQAPLGQVYPDEGIDNVLRGVRDRCIITVGDVTTDIILSRGIVPALSVIDLQVHRKPYKKIEEYHFPSDATIVKVASGPGYISREAQQALASWADSRSNSTNPTVIVVDGEEDLLTLSAIMVAPAGSVLFYGQPRINVLTNRDGSPVREGLVEITISEDIRKKASELLSQFTTEHTQDALI
jgi:pantetheine-phosphate adenylyltransferase